MTKILYITNGISGAGGLERVLSVKTAALIDELGYEIHIITLNDPNPKPFYIFHNNIKFHDLQVAGNPVNYIKEYISGIHRIAEVVNADVISVCDDGLKGFFVPTILAKKFSIIYERHASLNLNFKRGGSGISIKNKIAYLLMQRLAKTFDRFVVLTKGNLSEWRGNNLAVIPNPLSFYPAVSAGLTSTKVIAVGSHSYNKGYDLLLNAWSRVTKQHPNWTLDIFGRSDAESTYKKMAVQMQLSNVSFHDPVADIQSRYLSSSIMVLPSRSEGFGMVLIEAMACGVPCVSFDCPCGPADIISDGDDGFLVPNGDVDEFAEKIITLIKNEKLRNNMGQSARQNVKRFLPAAIVSQWDELFKSVQR